MSLLTYTPVASPAKTPALARMHASTPATLASSRAAVLKRLYASLLPMLLLVSGLVGIVALKVAIWVPRIIQ